MSKYPEIEKLVAAVTEDVNVRRATLYRDPWFTLKISRQRRVVPRDKAETLLLTYGLPNYAERQFINRATAADFGKVQLQYWPAKPVTRRRRTPR